MSKHKPYVIVVGVDYTKNSDLALERALALAAENTCTQVHVIHVLPLDLPAFTAEGVADTADHFPSMAEASAKLHAHVNEALTARRNQGLIAPESVTTHLRIELAANEVAQLAADLEADLVVVGTRGRRGVARLLLGSVAEATVRLAPCPVLVVRPKAVPEPVPVIEPPCPRCVQARKAGAGADLWCEQHRERHGQRHTYFQSDRAGAETNMPLVVRS